MANLRREAGAFFFFCFTTLLATQVQSAILRTLACITRTSDQAIIPSAVLSLGLMIYTGFTTPPEYMPGWSRWMAYINPLAYGFEALMANESHRREFFCVDMVPRGQGYTIFRLSRASALSLGQRPARPLLMETTISISLFGYLNVHKWRPVYVSMAGSNPAYQLFMAKLYSKTVQARTNHDLIRVCLVQARQHCWTFWQLASPPVSSLVVQWSMETQQIPLSSTRLAMLSSKISISAPCSSRGASVQCHS